MSDKMQVQGEEKKPEACAGIDQPPTVPEKEKTNGGCVGPNAKFVKLVAQDGHEFIVNRDHAMEVSATIRGMLSGPGEYAEGEVNEIPFPQIPSHILEIVCRYINYRVKYLNTSQSVPEFPIDSQISYDLLLAANFLQC